MAVGVSFIAAFLGRSFDRRGFVVCEVDGVAAEDVVGFGFCASDSLMLTLLCWLAG